MQEHDKKFHKPDITLYVICSLPSYIPFSQWDKNKYLYDAKEKETSTVTKITFTASMWLQVLKKPALFYIVSLGLSGFLVQSK